MCFTKQIQLSVVVMFCFTMMSCNNPTDSGSNNNTNTVTDINGNVYRTVKIGKQIWTVENIRTTKYNDGTSIPHVTDGMAWSNLTTPGYCFYSNSTDILYQEKWGALYNGYAVTTDKLAPAGWRVPTEADWTTLEDYLIANGYNWDSSTNDDKLGKSLATQTDWSSSNFPGNVGNDRPSNNSSGFSALPGSCRGYNGDFYDQGRLGFWWSDSTGKFDVSSAYSHNLSFNGSSLGGGRRDKKFGLSVRLVRDSN